MAERAVSMSVVVPAPAGEIFALLTDPARHAEIDGSGTVRGNVSASEVPMRLGSRFWMSMTLGPLPYRIVNTVVEFEPDHLIAWRHLMGHRWRYELEPADGGTRVTETFDYTTHRFPPFVEAVGYPDRNAKGIEQTLERLRKRFA